MKLESIEIDKIIVEKSPYHLYRYIISEEVASWPETLTPLPVVVLEQTDGLHLLDGFRRLRYLHHKGATQVEAIVVPLQGPTEVCRLLYTLHQHRIRETTMQKVLFLNLALSIGGSLEECAKLVNLKGHRDLREEVLKISDLPDSIKRFFHGKNFSYLQILTFLVYPLDVLQTVIDWKDRLTLTAQVFEELVANLAEYLQRQGRSVQEFLQDEKLNEILASDEPPKRRTEALRQYIRQLRFPYLEGINRAVRQRIEVLRLPSNVQVLWDRTLEESWVEVKIRVHSEDDITAALQESFPQKISKTLKEIIKLLSDGALDK